jgi:hypothetical protein
MEQLTVNDQIACSPMANALGASIKVTLPKQGMYLIVGDHTPLEPLVKSHGGEIILRLAGFRLLAALPFSGYLSLRANRNIKAIGPVTVDGKRLAAVIGLLVKTRKTNPT